MNLTMKYSFFKILISLFLLLFTNCKDEIVNNSTIIPSEFYKLEGKIFLNSFPVPNVDICLDTLKCTTDTSGYFIFDSLKSQTSKIKIVHPHCNVFDTIITIASNLYLPLNLKYISNLFFPLSVGNRWLYSINTIARPTVEVKVLKEILINTKYYFMLEKAYLNGTPIDTFYYRFDEDKLIELLIGTSPSNYYLETVFADFASTELDTFKYYVRFNDKDYYYDAYIFDTSTINIEEIAFYYHLYGVSDMDFQTYFRIGVGLTKNLHSFGGPREFLYAYYIK